MSLMKFKTDDASVSLYPDAPDWDGLPSAALANFRAKDAASADAVLTQALDWAKAQNIPRLLAPMEGDTWHSYRFVTESDGSPAFLMEPQNPDLAPEAFARAGFRKIAGYFSARVPLAQMVQSAPEDSADFQIDQWDGTDATALFTQVHAMSLQAFSKNAFYKPIALQAFLDMYLPIVPMLRPELIHFARKPDGELAGFVFGIPNYAEGMQPKSAILKTYASLTRGAGRHLSYAFHQAALTAGYQDAIHALIHDDNLSALRSATEGAKVFRRYALFGLDLNG